MIRLLVLPLLLLGACAAAPPAGLTAGTCGDRATVGHALGEAGESIEAMGLNRASAETTTLWLGARSWTVVQANRFGAHCIIAAGEEWRDARGLR